MSVLIDPYMFELSNEQEIRDNITFFMNVIKIASYPEKSKRISIAVYSGMIEKMQKRAIQPFPIQLSMIQDKDLKSTIMQLNNSFSNALIRFVENIDIDECVGNQEFVVRNDEKMSEDDHYFELLSTLLVPCYSETVDLDSKILTGNKENGKQIGDTFELVCNCDTREYQKTCSFISVDDLVSDKDKVIQELKQKKKKGGIPVKIIDDFKNNMTVDILIVFNMLLTGFDAPRLKRLYFGRKLKDHNLLQAITRVNRPYKENRYGYVIDFANIKRNFEETNEAYLKELNRFNDPNEVGTGNETDTFKQVIEDPAELIKQMQEVQQVLFNYTTDNAEEFSSEISTIEDKQELLKLKKILIAARDCCNLVRTFGDDELKETFAKMELTKLPSLISEVQHHIDNINQKELFASDDTTKLLVNEAMEDITFNFSKISEEELKIVGGKDAVTEKYKKTVRAFTQNIDPDDPEFITLQEAFLLRFKQHGFEPKSVSEIEEQGKELEDILKKLDELQKKNTVLLRKYNGDAKFARVHKRIREENLARKAANKQPIVSEYDMSIMNVLLSIKSDIDQKVYDRND